MPDTRYTVEYTSNRLSPEWDKFVVNGTLFQTTAWANFCKHYYNVDYFCITVKGKNGSTVAGCVVNVEKIARYGKIGYIKQGPCFKNRSEETVRFMIDEIKRFAKLHHLTYVAVALNYTENSLKDLFESEGFFTKNKNLPPFSESMKMKATWVLSLQPSIDEIFNQMSSNRKRNIRKGLKSPVTVRMGSRADLQCAHELMQYTSKKHDDEMMPLNELYSLWDNLAATEQAVLFLAEVEGKTTCCALNFMIGNVYIYFYWGWNEEYREYNVSAVLQWNMIQYAKEKGFEFYDFYDFNPECYRAIIENRVTDQLKNHLLFGPTLQKMQYGGMLKEYVPAMICYSSIFKKMRIETMLALKKSRLWKIIGKIIRRLLERNKGMYPPLE